MLDWIFEGIVTWVSSIASELMDAVSRVFLDALGTDMGAMEGYFPFVTKAFEVMQYMAWAVLFLITVWQLFRVFGGPITEAENPWQLLLRSALFALLVGAARPIFTMALDIARAPYTALMEVSMEVEDFTFAGIEEALKNGLTTIVSTVSIVGPILILILLIALGWNYFKLLLECVERYIVVGVLCYTSPLAFAMGGSKATNQVFKSWCRMVGSQLLLLVLNVWFLRAFDSSVGQFIGNGGALASGGGSVFLWLFCALAFLKTAQKFDSYLAAMGLNVAQTGSSMAMEMVMAARVLSGLGGGAKSAGSVFRSGAVAVVAVYGVAWMADTMIAAHLDNLKTGLIEYVNQYPWAYAIVLLLVSKFVNSQGAALAIVVPAALGVGVSPGIIVAFSAACYGYYILPTYPSDLAAIQFDRSGTTHIGRFVINHSFIIPGLLGVFVASVVGWLLAAMYGFV